MLYYKDIFATATDIISLLYKGAAFQQSHPNMRYRRHSGVRSRQPKIEVGTAKITGARFYTDYAGAVSGSESYVKIGGVMRARHS